MQAAAVEQFYQGVRNMKWEGREQSSNVEDRRGMRGPAVAAGGGGILLVVLMIVMNMMGANDDQKRLVANVAKGLQDRAASAPVAPGKGIDDKSKEFISVILHDTETIWTKLFKEHFQGRSYTPPKVVIFSDSVASGCGNASAAMGPFYCPADEQVYIDPTFFDELATRHHAKGDFAQAYVLAHEVAHHVQNLTGYSDIVNQERSKGDERHSNQMSVRLELQADFLAGVWAHHAHKAYDILEDGDMEEGINAANQIGDDTLQREAMRHVVPERFTHGRSDQRVKWFKKGLLSGKFKDCGQLFDIEYEKL
jgi:predicted metalloprotease